MTGVLLLALFLPLIGFLLLLTTSFWISRRLTGILACLTVLVSFLCFTGLAYFYTTQGISAIEPVLFPWIHLDRIQVDFRLHLDALSLLMALIITGVGFLIHVYSIGYMDHDEDYARYFACMNFFIFSMLLLVLAGDLLLLFIGWEGVGLASYLLIGFWYYRPAAAKAATKAFVVNRIGDWGLLMGLLLTFQLFGTAHLTEIFQQATSGFAVGAPLITILTLLYFWGAIGKSAQLPLYVWLPDAMEGPTPVSALIHAATMVTAGVYLVVRMHPIFLLAPDTLEWVGYVGGATALFAALCALGQTDLKRVLAYSTISQLGLMFLACGIGAFYAAMFHLTTHAFVKGLLFLSAGNVVHMMKGLTDMNKMGGLSKIFTKTHWLFLIGALSMAGIPPLAIFFSKDLILEEEYLAGFKTLFYVGLTTSFLTAVYLTRAYCLTFTGALRLEQSILNSVKEAPRIMLIPVAILAFLTLVGGFLGFSASHTPILESFLAEGDVTLVGKEFSTGFHLSPETWASIGVAFLGVGLSALMYTRFVNELGSTRSVLKNGFFINDLYAKVFVSPLKGLSRWIVSFTEPQIFNAFIRNPSYLAEKISQGLQRFQSGQIRSYVAWMAIGMVILVMYFIV